MSVAYLPSPARGVWQLGPVPVRAYALCAIAGVVVALWLTDRRYRRMGGPQGMIWDVATVAVPAGIIGARVYSVLTGYESYFGRGSDWVSVFRIWDGGLGLAGLVGAGALGAWAYCRRYRYALAPMALAAAPALAVGQAIAAWGNWFNQRMYGPPSTLPFAVAIGPQRRANGYESFSTFQPVFLYESAWDLVLAAVVIYAIRRFALTGDRAVALYAGLYAVGRLVAETARIDYSPRLLGTRIAELEMLLIVLAAAAYLAISRVRRGRPVAVGQGAAPDAAPLGGVPAGVSPPAATPAPVTPAVVTPAVVTPAVVTPAVVTPAAVTPAAVTPAAPSPGVAGPGAASPADGPPGLGPAPRYAGD
jgi:prolipoprotein diacylglyceryl transferase